MVEITMRRMRKLIEFPLAADGPARRPERIKKERRMRRRTMRTRRQMRRKRSSQMTAGMRMKSSGRCFRSGSGLAKPLNQELWHAGHPVDIRIACAKRIPQLIRYKHESEHRINSLFHTVTSCSLGADASYFFSHIFLQSGRCC